MNPFTEAYKGIPAWDIGKPQNVFVELFQEGRIRGSILDVGCGTGENALFLAEQGLEVVGVDATPNAIMKAREKAQEREINIDFEVLNVFELYRIDKKFDTVIDSGLFHFFPDELRRSYTRSLAGIIKPGGKLYLLCFSDLEPGNDGPRRISRQEIIENFSSGWRIDDISLTHFETNEEELERRGWIATMTKIPANHRMYDYK